MSKPVSVAALKKNIKDNPESIKRLARVLPQMMMMETNEKVWVMLEKRMIMVRDLMNEKGLTQ
jgi:hypothetical protein|tara:strand:+ start:497 stop:685 length:189 start_codon:yes stop_codon:yes gene_type:complete